MKMNGERNRGQREDREEGGQTTADLAFIMCHRLGFGQDLDSYWRWIQYGRRGRDRRRDRHPGLHKSPLSGVWLRTWNTSSVMEGYAPRALEYSSGVFGISSFLLSETG